MSRYTKKIKGPNGKTCDLAWGFDETFGYWYEIYNENEEEPIEDKSSIGGLHGTCDRGEFLEILVEYNCPEEHKKMVALDYPF